MASASKISIESRKGECAETGAALQQTPDRPRGLRDGYDELSLPKPIGSRSSPLSRWVSQAQPVLLAIARALLVHRAR
jgi:hypothetical protein